jgi:hybrid cluster-associated redox disulfide protein
MVEAHANVAALIERFGAPAERILGRYGLHCAGCPHATAESVAHAAERHGVEAGRVDRMLRELAIVLKGGADLSPSH